MRTLLRSTFLATLVVVSVSAYAGKPSPKPTPTPCPLSDNDSEDNDSEKSVNSPENKPKKVLISHNGHTICVSQSAAAAHQAHGDTILGPCH